MICVGSGVVEFNLVRVGMSGGLSGLVGFWLDGSELVEVRQGWLVTVRYGSGLVVGGWLWPYKGQGFRIMPWQGQIPLRVVGVSLEIVSAGPCSKAYPGSSLLVLGQVLCRCRSASV